jgi:hypothetical protein
MGSSDTVSVRIKHAGTLGLASTTRVETWYPGEETPVRLAAGAAPDAVDIRVPLRRGCAFLVLSH